MRPFKLILIIATMLTIAACTDTGNTAGDATSAQRLLPNLAGYTTTDIDTAINGAFTAAGTAALASGQPEITVALAKADQMLQCFQYRGAIAAKTYNEDGLSGFIPKTGAVLVINQTRLSEELINCVLGGQEETFGAQSLTVEPCMDAGFFTYQGDSISYVYVGSDPALCALYDQHFNNLRNSG